MLFDELKLREITLRNRIAVAPMCQYSCEDGFATDWHLVHLGSRAVGGAGLVITEATAVEPRGRISPADLGIWKDAHVEQLARITEFVRSQGAAVGIQLAHAGRKGSTGVPWEGLGAVDEKHRGWQVIAPGEESFAADYAPPKKMTKQDISEVVSAFAGATKRALAAHFDVVEIHAAHGYLLHEFLSPLSNSRDDEYGGSFENRIRLVLQVVEEVRRVWPQRLPLIMRISSTDWVDGGWDIEQSIELARKVKDLGVDLIDCSSGGNVATATVPAGPGYQTQFAERVRADVGIPTSAVGMITSPQQAEHILRTGQADLVSLGRELLRDPYWTLRAATALKEEGPWPKPYLRARP